jgi:hypothetical protein
LTTLNAGKVMPRTVFISYRRADAQGYAQNLHYRLASWFDHQAELFFDAANIESGQDFPQRLVDGIDAAAVVLVLSRRCFAANAATMCA